MKGAFHAGPAMEPLRQMYIAAHVSCGRRKAKDFHTLIIGNSEYHESDEQLPDAEAIEDGRNYAVGVEVCDHMGDFGVGRGRDKARVDCHGDSTLLGDSAREVMDCRRKRGGREGRENVGQVSEGQQARQLYGEDC